MNVHTDTMSNIPESTPELTRPSTSNRAALGIVFLVVFIDLLGFGIVLPLLPYFADELLKDKLQVEGAAAGLTLGLLMSSFSLMQFLFAPLWGQLSDRIGRRPVLLVSTATSAVSYALFGVAAAFHGKTGLLLLLASRIFAGIGGANLSVASAYIADVTTAENRS